MLHPGRLPPIVSAADVNSSGSSVQMNWQSSASVSAPSFRAPDESTETGIAISSPSGLHLCSSTRALQHRQHSAHGTELMPPQVASSADTGSWLAEPAEVIARQERRPPEPTVSTCPDGSHHLRAIAGAETPIMGPATGSRHRQTVQTRSNQTDQTRQTRPDQTDQTRLTRPDQNRPDRPDQTILLVHTDQTRTDQTDQTVSQIGSGPWKVRSGRVRVRYLLVPALRPAGMSRPAGGLGPWS